MDTIASNYDATANIDDGSCCLDNVLVIETRLEVTPGDLNFGPWSNWVGGWNVTLEGDTNIVLEGQDLTGFGFFGDDNSGSLPDGCYEFNATGVANGGWAWFNINGTQYDGPANGGAYGSPNSVLFTLGNATCPLYGCTDVLALNYDPAADTDDGSCAYPCTENEIAFNMYDAFGDGWNGATYSITDASGVVVFSGGLASGAFELSTLCLPTGCYNITVGGGTWDSEISFDFDTLIGAGVGTYIVQVGGVVCIPGCTDPTAINYDSTTTYDDGSCFYCQLTASSLIVNETGACDGAIDLTVNGTHCVSTNPLANNITYLWSNGLTGEDLSNVCAGSYTVTATDCYGCTVSETATVILSIDSGCTDPLAFNYDPTANTDDGSCIPFINGCTDTAAANYDQTANTDDGSCHYCFGSYSVTIECAGGAWQSEVSWDLLDANGNIILSGGAPFLLDTCLDGGCYTVDMFDAFGDGWNGNTISITDNVSGVSVSAGLVYWFIRKC